MPFWMMLLYFAHDCSPPYLVAWCLRTWELGCGLHNSFGLLIWGSLTATSLSVAPPSLLFTWVTLLSQPVFGVCSLLALFLEHTLLTLITGAGQGFSSWDSTSVFTLPPPLVFPQPCSQDGIRMGRQIPIVDKKACVYICICVYMCLHMHMYKYMHKYMHAWERTHV